jgi:hypothetical protein
VVLLGLYNAQGLLGNKEEEHIKTIIFKGALFQKMISKN